jgi:3-hydroxyacyl-[acyl-carrier-protein] dehydratase
MSKPLMDKQAIEAVIPHRDPMLFIDEVLELVPGVRVVARKTVTEADCAGHFPGKLALFAGIDDVRFKRIVRPGETLLLECEIETVRGPVGKGRAKATVDGQLAVRGTLTFAVGSE